jgi:3-hydroxyisobutyrate dehydrogenase
VAGFFMPFLNQLLQQTPIRYALNNWGIKMKVGFIGLGNVGSKLAGNLLRNSIDLAVYDLDNAKMAEFVGNGARDGINPAKMAQSEDILITCLPSPAASALVVEGLDGIISNLRPGLIWVEMSTTDANEIKRLADKFHRAGGIAAECPVSGGCHRAATGNISIYMGGDRATFDKVFPLLQILGRQILHTGPIGTASTLKVMTNYLATANLLTLCEALTTMKAAGMDLATTYQAIRISSGNSFVHETESQMILNGSRDIDFTMDLVLKDIGLFDKIAQDHKVPLEISPLMIQIFKDGQQRFGQRANSDDIIRRLEQATGLDITAPGFPAEMVDDQPPAIGYEVT